MACTPLQERSGLLGSFLILGGGEVDTEQAGRVGLKFNHSKKKWV